MKCPKCGEEMVERRCGLTKIYICPKCNRKVLEAFDSTRKLRLIRHSVLDHRRMIKRNE